MKKNLLLLLVIFFTQLVQAQTLVAFYPFTGNANDAVGTAHGTVNNGTALTTDRFGIANSAYYFDGIDDFIDAAADNLPTTNRTVSFWFNADAGSVVNKPGALGYGGNAGSCPGNSFFMALNLSGNASYSSQAHCNSNAFSHPYSTLPETRWYNWVITINGSVMKMYVNGSFVATTNTFTNPTGVTGKKLSIGAVVGLDGNSNFVDGNVGRFKGKIDDITIYNAALSDQEVFDMYVNDVKKPGSGNSLLFDNTQSEYIEIGNGWDQAGSFTFETWLKRTSAAVTDPNAQVFMVSFNTNGWGVGINQSGGAANQNKILLSKIGVGQVLSASAITDLNWHHVAVVFNSGTNQALFYIDGVLDATVSYNPGGFNSGNTNYRLGGRNNGGNTNLLNGTMDEVRIWSGVALTQLQIRDWMCRKINTSHPAIANLLGYYQFDEGSGTTTGGYNSKFGTLINTPTWQTSGASLGDASVHDYVNATKTANISHASGENFSATETTGTPTGIHVYRVDAQPNSNTGANNGGNNKYFGVFQVKGTSPQYTAVYNYSGNPYVTPANESTLRLAKRADNSVTSWTMLSTLPNDPANTITITGESTEYILGQLGSPLPLSLLGFHGMKENGTIKINWQTTDEANTSHFIVEKSANANIYSAIGTVAAMNRTGSNNYSLLDIAPQKGINYYRLKMVDIDGKFRYSNIVKVNFSEKSIVSISPNPATTEFILSWDRTPTRIVLSDLRGRIVKTFVPSATGRYWIGDVAKGAYVLNLITEENTEAVKVIIR